MSKILQFDEKLKIKVPLEITYEYTIGLKKLYLENLKSKFKKLNTNLIEDFHKRKFVIESKTIYGKILEKYQFLKIDETTTEICISCDVPQLYSIMHTNSRKYFGESFLFVEIVILKNFEEIYQMTKKPNQVYTLEKTLASNYLKMKKNSFLKKKFDRRLKLNVPINILYSYMKGRYTKLQELKMDYISLRKNEYTTIEDIPIKRFVIECKTFWEKQLLLMN